MQFRFVCFVNRHASGRVTVTPLTLPGLAVHATSVERASEELVLALSDRIVVMNAGRIEQLGKPEEIYRYPATRFVADFIGRANFIETLVEGVSNNVATVRLFGKPFRITLHNVDFKAGEKVTAMMRPEAIKLVRDVSAHQVKIEQAMYLGTEVEYMISFDGHTWSVSDPDPRTGRAFMEGEIVGVNVVEDAVHLLKS